MSVLLLCAAVMQAEPAPRKQVRIGLWSLWRDHELLLTPLQGARVQLCPGCPVESLPIARLRGDGSTVKWLTAGRKAQAAAVVLLTGELRIAAHGESLRLTDPLSISSHHGVLQLVVTLPVESYVELAVAAESGPADSFESRKALAVVARSFALDSYLQKAHGHVGFDLCDSTHCQWIRWRSTPEAHQATLATAGEVLWFKGHRVGAVFHQNCGGRTASASEIWPEREASQRLVSQQTAPPNLAPPSQNSQAQLSQTSQLDPYCPRVSSAVWSATLTLNELTRALALAGLARPGWRRLTVEARAASGRPAALMADQTRIATEDFRLAVGRLLGWNRIKSNWFEVAPAGQSFIFHGRGSGHGVGLCQVGAAEMAREGKHYDEILRQYFPLAVVGELYRGQPWLRFSAEGFTLESNVAADRLLLPNLKQALAGAVAASGITPHRPITLRAYGSTEAFRQATLAPGWVAAFTEGDQIALQPLLTLKNRGLLQSVAQHEFLHALVEGEAARGTPLWLREGLVEALLDPTRLPASKAQRSGSYAQLSPEQVSQLLVHAQSEAESTAAHRAAFAYASALLQRFGRTQTLEWLRSSVPAAALEQFKAGGALR